MPKDLPQLKQSPGAILGALYRLYKRDFVPPRHSGYESIAKRQMHVPAPRCAAEFRQLYNGYMTANSVVYARDAREPLHMIVCDEAELKAAVACASAHCGEDNSQRPRPVSIWLLLPDTFQPGALSQNRRYLDGLATWCTENELVRHVRFNVAAGVDADDFLRRTQPERTCGIETADVTRPRVVARWCTLEGELRSEVRNLPAVSDGADAQTRIQSIAATLCVEYGAPLHANGYSSVSPDAIKHVDSAFDRMVRHVSASFDAVVNGCACVTRSGALNEDDGPLQFTGNFVRVTPKNAPLHNVDACTFHGLILAPRCKHEQVQQHCSLFANGMRAPRGMAEEMLGMHLCAIHVEERALGQAVSLFGLEGIPGRPIARPHSTTPASVPFLRPLEDSLFQNFLLEPCSKESLLPAEPCHHEGYANFFERCMQLYTDTSGAAQEEDGPNALMRPWQKADGVAPLPKGIDANRDFVLTALRINMRSERTTVGDALCDLFAGGAPRSLITLLINAVRHRGVGMPLCDMLGDCAELFGSATRSMSAVVDENDRLKRLALVSLTFSLPAEETLPDGGSAQLGAAPDEIMRRVMTACGLVRGKKTLLSRKGVATQWSKAVAVMAEAVSTHRSLGLATIEHVEAILQHTVGTTDETELSAHEWSRRVDHATGAAMAAIVMSRDAKSENVFFLHKNNTEMYVLQQLAADGATAPCSFDTLLKTERPHVLIVHRGVGALRLTACRRT